MSPVAGYRAVRAGSRFWLYRPKTLRRGVGIAVSMALLGTLALFLGSYPVGGRDVLSALTGHVSAEAGFIVGALRLPRILLALLTGAILGMAGAAMQSVTRNGLADPGLIGVKEGAVVAILSLLVFFPSVGNGWYPLAGLLGGGLVAGTVLLIARSVSGVRFILVGIGVSWMLGAAVSLFVTTARISEVQTAMIWLSGSLHAASWSGVTIAAPWAAFGLLVLLATARSGDVASLGDVAARGLGVRLGRLDALRLAASVAITAASVAVIGSMGFVGLIAPHFARFVFGSAQLPLLTGSALIGGLLVLAADTVGRSAFAPVQIPAGVVMAVIGTPFFLLILWRRRHEI